MKKYIFNVWDKYPDGLIPKALYRAQLTKPCGEIKEKWEAEVLKAANEDELGRPPRFSWAMFVKSMVP